MAKNKELVDKLSNLKKVFIIDLAMGNSENANIIIKAIDDCVGRLSRANIEVLKTMLSVQVLTLVSFIQVQWFSQDGFEKAADLLTVLRQIISFMSENEFSY